jgi:hypothetical protein
MSKHGLLQREMYWILEPDSYWLLKLDSYLQQLTDIYLLMGPESYLLMEQYTYTGLRDQLLAPGTSFLLTKNYLLLDTVTRFWNQFPVCGKLLSSGNIYPLLDPVSCFWKVTSSGNTHIWNQLPASATSYQLLEPVTRFLTSFMLTESYLLLETVTRF